ncbi:MAG: dTDP-4-dehydrorhamnose 3,5-epimerase family protein [Desulfoprunum sp.]|nr:dTDP-4-dehydrorhamnose 3,5-epimerase family protein [Desulfoprunum sp.]
MKSILTNISGVLIVETAPYRDERGHFYRAFCRHELASIVGGRRIEQINLAHTSSVGAIRGMHFQLAPHAEMKMIRCIKGKVWDVAVDLRKDSATYLQWHAVELSRENCNMVVIPEGCAHGFQVLEPESELLYLHTAGYSPESEGGVRFDDPLISISWPLPVSDISNRDLSYPFLQSDYSGLIV